MISLTFHNSLTVSTWSWGNNYNFYNVTGCGKYFLPDKERLFFLTNSNYHPIKDGLQEMKWDIETCQFNNRVLTTTKIKDVLNSCMVPIKVKIGREYIIAKGFLADYNDGHLNILFAATSVGTPLTPNDLKLYRSRNVDLPIHKKVKNAIDQTIADHKGDLIVTNNIDNYIGAKVTLPIFKSISEAKKGQAEIASDCLKSFFVSFGNVQALEKNPVVNSYSSIPISIDEEDDYEEDYEDEYDDEDED